MGVDATNRNINWITSHEGSNTTQLPIPQYVTHDRSPALQRGQGVYAIDYKHLPPVKVSVTSVEIEVEWITRAAGERCNRNVRNRMPPGIGKSPGKPVGEATIELNLQPVVFRFASRFTQRNRSHGRESAIIVRNRIQIWITVSEGGNNRCSPIGWNLVEIQPSAPNVLSLVSNIRNF